MSSLKLMPAARRILPALLFAIAAAWHLAVIAQPAGVAQNTTAHPPIPLIFDTDIGNDVDDVLALGMILSCKVAASVTCWPSPSPKTMTSALRLWTRSTRFMVVVTSQSGFATAVSLRNKASSPCWQLSRMMGKIVTRTTCGLAKMLRTRWIFCEGHWQARRTVPP